LAKPAKIYWDSCAWLGFLNGEAGKTRELEIVYSNARQGLCELWTSTLAVVETRRLGVELHDPKPLSEAHHTIIRDLFRQPFVKTAPVSLEIAEAARTIWRETSNLKKFQDAIHLATALRWSASVLHTYDNADLTHLSLKFKCKNGEQLPICYPNETTDGPLFAAQKGAG
jgi:predicted nucleic acid-binding protein